MHFRPFHSLWPLLFLSACHLGPAPDAVATETDSLEERRTAFFQALSARDAEGVTALFHEDGVLHVAGRPAVEGREAIGGFYANVFRFLAATSASSERLEIAEAGEMAWEAGVTANEFDGPDGPVRYAGKYLLVWEKVEGEWGISAYGISSDQPEG